MKKRFRIVIKIVLPLIVVMLAALGIFFLQPPVLVVTDQYFIELYGKNRTIFAQVQSSILLFRQVKLVTVPEDIGPDGIAFAVSEVSANPFAACFPYRYLRGAEQYQTQFPSIKTLLFAGKEEPSEVNEAFFIVRTDTQTDLYREGFSAAIIAQQTEGKILNYIERGGNTEDKSLFEQGVKDGGKEGSAIFIDLNRNYSDETEIACIMLTGSSEDAFITKDNIPIIMRSWADPRLFPPQVKLLSSDSLWETLVSAIKMTQNNTEERIISLPSRIKLRSGSNFSQKTKNQLRKAMKALPNS